MARVPSKHGRDQAMEFQGFLIDLQDWEASLKDKDKKMVKPLAPEKGKLVSSSQKAGMVSEDRKTAGRTPTVDRPSRNGGQYDDYLRKYDALSGLSSGSTIEDGIPDASSEKEQGNEYYKQNKFKEAIECYSRSIALSPTAVAYANRAMAYLKIRRFQNAEEDCTEALNLDDRYIKAYSRRAKARKELGKLKESVDDAEFALRLEPNNQEVKKQYAEAKSLYEKDLLQRASGALKRSTQGEQKSQKTKIETNGRVQEVSSASSSIQEARVPSSLEHTMRNHRNGKLELKASVQDLASRAASHAMTEAAKNIITPTSAYQFEVSWQGLSGDCALQARLLKAISPSTLPQLFKNALTAPILVDIIKCLATIFVEEMEFTVNYLEHLTKVPRFDMIILCLSSENWADLCEIWDEVFSKRATSIETAEVLDKLHSRYCPMR